MKKVILLCGLLFSLTTQADLAKDSLYQSETLWQLETGEKVQLEKLSGKIQVVAFVYTHCISMCPVIVMDLQRIQKSLNKKELLKTQFTLISLDPNKDSLETKQAFLQEHKLVGWHFLSSTEQDTRELALLFNIKYRNEGDEIVHSNTISVLDTQGRLIYQRNGSNDLTGVIQIIKETTKK